MQKFSLSKGFTLIELLVVIAILGILAAVVLIAINPAERIAEANDTQVRSDISTLASAIEACFTGEATGFYDNCLNTTALSGKGYLKTAPKTNQASNDLTYLPSTDADATTQTIAEMSVYAALKAKSAGTKAGCTTGQVPYYQYRTTDGSSKVVCGEPSAP